MQKPAIKAPEPTAGHVDPVERAARYEQIRADEILGALEASFATGFDALPRDLTRDELDRRLGV